MLLRQAPTAPPQAGAAASRHADKSLAERAGKEQPPPASAAHRAPHRPARAQPSPALPPPAAGPPARPPRLRPAARLLTRPQPRQEAPRPHARRPADPRPQHAGLRGGGASAAAARIPGQPAGPRRRSLARSLARPTPRRSLPRGGKRAQSGTPHSLCQTKLFRPRTAGAILLASPTSRRAAPFRSPVLPRRALFRGGGRSRAAARCAGCSWGGAGFPPAVPAPPEPCQPQGPLSV